MAQQVHGLIPYFVNFSIVVVILAVALRKPARKFIYQRHERMRDAVESASRAHLAATQRIQAAKKSLQQFAEEERVLLQREANGAEVERREILEKASTEVQRLQREADRLSAVEQDEASEQVKAQFLDLVVGETEENLRRGLKKDDHSAILKRAQNSIEVGV